MTTGPRTGPPAGLPRERTSLAWQRTAVSATVALLLPLVVDARIGAWPLLYVGLVLSVAALTLVLGALSRMRQLRGDGEHAGGSPWELIWRAAVVTVLAAGSGVATAVTQLMS